MRKPVVIITGAGGEIGHGLIDRLKERDDRRIVTIDVSPLDGAIARKVDREVTGSIVDRALLERVMAEFEVDLIFHLAALLSTRAEFTPVAAHQVNVEGTLNLLEFAQHEGESHGRPVVFIYPSSIAAYGLADLETKARAGKVREDEYLHPTTMYGCNKLYCELLGDYYARHYKQLAADTASGKVDFRCVRFPGLISAQTVPSGGTSDYAPEMIHAAARGEPYACFVRPDTRIPFMAMPDGVAALLTLASAPRARLRRTSYNVGAFNPSAEEIRAVVTDAFPGAAITWETDRKRQAIVDSWPADVDDAAARRDWGFEPHHDFDRAFSEYLIPTIRRRYASRS
jgi:nucleoside-diphosphate-sugar epimerase